MSFLGMGTFEILVVLLLAFILLGPERMFDVARKLGKLVAEVRKMAADLPDIVLDEEPPPTSRNRNATDNIAPMTSDPAPRPSSEKSDGSPDQSTPDVPEAADGAVPRARVSPPKPPESTNSTNADGESQP